MAAGFPVDFSIVPLPICRQIATQIGDDFSALGRAVDELGRQPAFGSPRKAAFDVFRARRGDFYRYGYRQRLPIGSAIGSGARFSAPGRAFGSLGRLLWTDSPRAAVYERLCARRCDFYRRI